MPSETEIPIERKPDIGGAQKASWFILGFVTFLTAFSIVWANTNSRGKICNL